MRATGPPSGPHGRLVAWARRTVGADWFGHGVTTAITVNAVVIGLDTSVALAARFGGAFDLASKAFLAIFVVEALIKMAAVWPRLRDYFADPWNMFDFTVIVVSLVPSTGGLATLARLVRLFRVLRLMSALPELQLIVSTLIRSVPGMFNVLALMSIVFYVYGVAGYHLFRELDPDHWRTLGISLLSLFRIATLEGWTDIMYAALEHHWWAWVYFVSFVVVETFVVLNLFVAVVINSLEEAKHDRKQEVAAPSTRAQLLAELSRTRGGTPAAAGAAGPDLKPRPLIRHDQPDWSMVSPGRERRSVTVEADNVCVGGKAEGVRGRPREFRPFRNRYATDKPNGGNRM